jgi:uncharacterized membrane protein YphA (DoxX/SURF4 family)
VIFRIYVGTNLFFHGFMRFATSLEEWEMREAASFADTFLPMPLVHLALYLIPYVQVFLGTCIVIGVFTWWALIGGLGLFFILLFGHVVRMNWSGAHTVMHYAVYYWVLLALLTQNRLALDRLREKEP